MKRVSMRPQLFLIVQHEGFRSLISTQLLEEGYRVREISTLEKALPLLQSARTPPSVFILDTGSQLLTLDALDQLPDELPLLVLSGPLDRSSFLFKHRTHSTVLEKPFTIKELVAAVRKICYKLN